MSQIDDIGGTDKNDQLFYFTDDMENLISGVITHGVRMRVDAGRIGCVQWRHGAFHAFGALLVGFRDATLLSPQHCWNTHDYI